MGGGASTELSPTAKEQLEQLPADTQKELEAKRAEQVKQTAELKQQLAEQLRQLTEQKPSSSRSKPRR
jgi:hypothetical protein